MYTETCMAVDGAAGGVVAGEKQLLVHAVVGFDERPILHCLGYAMRRGVVRRLTLYRPPAGDETAARRNQLVVSTVESFVRSIGGEVVVTEVPSELLRAVPVMRRSVSRDLAEPGTSIVACLASGMRVLVLALYNALLAQRRELHERIHLYIEPEGRPEEGFAICLADLTALIIPFLLGERPIETEVVEYLMERNGCATLAEIYKGLEERYPRSTLYRVLQRLASAGVVKKDARGVYCLQARIEKMADWASGEEKHA